MGRVGSLEVADYANTTSTLVNRIVAIGGVGGTGATARYILPSLALNLDFTTGTLDPRITFTRASTGSYYNSAGALTQAAVNLLTYSEQFDNAYWLKQNATISSNTLAKIGRAHV